jgi:DNA-binding MarR family transcriptional regulator
MSSGAVSLADYRALAELRYQLRRFLGFSEQAARAAGLEPRQHQLLLAVKGMPEGKEATIGELADRLQVRHHSAVELVDRMEARDLVRRERADADRRQVHVRLTPQGEKLLLRMSLSHRGELRSIAPALVRSLQILAADG